MTLCTPKRSDDESDWDMLRRVLIETLPKQFERLRLHPYPEERADKTGCLLHCEESASVAIGAE